MKKKLVFRGVATALITPFSDGRINYTSLTSIIERQIDSGVSALVVGGTTGEAATLSDSERYQLYAYVKESVGGRVKLIFGTGTNDTLAAIRHTAAAARIGCDGILVVTPYYNKGTYRGVVEHYKKIASESPLPLILYNVPSRTGVNLTLEQLSELSECENIVAIKEASDSLDRLIDISIFGDKLYLYAGNDSQTFTSMSLGGMGVISVLSNLYPEIMVKICKLCDVGRYESALLVQQKIHGLIKALFVETNPAPIKYAMAKKGLSSAELRLPLYSVTEESKRILDREISLFERQKFD